MDGTGDMTPAGVSLGPTQAGWGGSWGEQLALKCDLLQR